VCSAFFPLWFSFLRYAKFVFVDDATSLMHAVRIGSFITSSPLRLSEENRQAVAFSDPFFFFWLQSGVRAGDGRSLPLLRFFPLFTPFRTKSRRRFGSPGGLYLRTGAKESCGLSSLGAGFGFGFTSYFVCFDLHAINAPSSSFFLSYSLLRGRSTVDAPSVPFVFLNTTGMPVTLAFDG